MAEVEFHPLHLEAWKVAQAKDVASVHGAIVEALAIAVTPPSHLLSSDVTCQELTTPELSDSASVQPPPDGFVLTGTLDIFGIDGLRTHFYSHHAPSPSHLDLPKDILPIYQLAIVRGPVHASTFFPEFSGTLFDTIKLEEVNVTYQNYSLDRSRAVGWHIGASITFDKSYGAIHDTLEYFIGINDPRLNISCNLGMGQDWHKLPSVSSFALEGVFSSMCVRPCDTLTFARIGARITGHNALEPLPMGTFMIKKVHGFGIFGKMHVAVPGRTIPLEMDFDVVQTGATFALSASLGLNWDNAFGIPNLTLDELKLSTFLSLDHPWDSLTFDVEAILDIGPTMILLEGMFSLKGDFMLTATISDFTWDHICAMYNHLFGMDLAAPDFHIHIESVSLIISASGLTFELHELQVGDYLAVDGILQMKSSGALLRAGIANGKLELDGFVIEQAFAEVSFAHDDGNNSTSLMLGGKFKWRDFVVQVGAHIYKISADEELHYTLFGSLDGGTSENGFSIAEHIPGLEATCLKDIVLQDAAIIVASRDDAGLGALSHCTYPVQKGVQICASLSNCRPMSNLAGIPDPSLVLSLAWCDSELDISILSRTPIPLKLGPSIVTDSISFHIVLGTVPKLQLKAGAHITVSGSDKPLHFLLEVELDEMGGTLTGHLAGGWNNPFGLGPDLTVGPNLLLSASILYAGVPSGVGFVGGLQVGKSSGQVAFQVSEHPSKQLFSVDVGNIDLLDIVSLTRSVIQCDLADPANVIEFESVKIYVCPVALTLGTIAYPQGFSFICHAVLFGKRVDVNVVIQKTGARMVGAMDNFTLGPLEISGNKAAGPSFDIELSATRQAGIIDGKITFCGEIVSVYCNFQLTPKFSFEFAFNLSFAGLFDFEVHASPVENSPGSTSSGLLPDDYLLTAKFQDKGCGRIAHRIDQLFHEKAREERAEAERTQKRIDAEREKWEAKIAQDQAELDAAHAAWEAKSQAAHAQYDEKDRQTKAEVARLQHELDMQRQKFHDELAKAKAELWVKQHEREVAIDADEEKLRRTRQEWADELNKARHGLEDATRKMHSSFGNAQSDIDEAIRKVNSLQDDINHVGWQLRECDDASIWDVPKKAAIPGLAIKFAGLEAARGVAEGALNIAKRVLEAGDFIACKGAMETAQLAVNAAQSSSGAAIDAAVDALEVTKKATHGLVSAAEEVVSSVERAGAAAVEVAQGALEAGEKVALDSMHSVRAVLDGLSSCEEWVEYQLKKEALELAKTTGSGAFRLANAGVEAGEEIVQGALVVGHWVMEQFTSLVTITDIELSLKLGQAKCFEFDARVKGSKKGDPGPFEYNLRFDPQDAMKLITDIFARLVEEVEKDILSPLEI